MYHWFTDITEKELTPAQVGALREKEGMKALHKIYERLFSACFFFYYQ